MGTAIAATTKGSFQGFTAGSFSGRDRRPRPDQDPLLIEAGTALSIVPVCTKLHLPLISLDFPRRTSSATFALKQLIS
jgi:hypothetical protein